MKQEGRGESIWDRFCQTPGNILHGDNGDEANNHYNLFREDVALMKKARPYRLPFLGVLVAHYAPGTRRNQ